MKNSILFLLICLFSSVSFSQDTFTMTIVNTKGRPVANVDVIGTSSDTTITKKTNAYGQVVFTLSKVGVYSFSYLDQKDVTSYEVREGFSGTSRRTVTYDPEGRFAVQPKEDRTGVNFATTSAYALRGKPGTIKVTVDVKERNGVGVSGLSLEVVSVSEAMKYEGRTNSMGKAIFYLKTNAQYEVDIDGAENLSKFKVPDLGPGGEMREVVFYEKTKVAETVKGDTIIQQGIRQKTGTSTHMLFTLNLKDYDGNILPHEPVYAKAENSNLVYEGVTNDQGECKFMLKKGHNYFINLKYEDNIALVECSNKRGFALMQISRRYRGSEEIERMLDTRRLNENGFVVNHRPTPTFPANKPANYLTRTSDGLKIDFESNGPMGTPTIVGNCMFVPESYYSPNFYCLNATTGDFMWGVAFGESGPSPAVHHNGVILVNTESCTLYALDASTGDLLWSKWLAGYLYTTPSADGDNVYVVYNNGGSNPRQPGQTHVLANFDLRTGKVNWMQWIDDEVIASPVVAGDEVHIASHRGNYYIFDKESGLPKKQSFSIKAVSSPTVTDDAIYITAQKGEKEKLVVLDRKTLEEKRTYSVDLDAATINGSGLFECMNFNGSHPIVYKNKTVLVLDNNSLRAFDAQKETLLWEKSISAHPNQIPIVANEQVVVAGNDGTIKSFRISDGKETIVASNQSEIDGQPVAKSGKLFVSAAGAIMIIKSIVNPEWKQWNKDAQHNLVID